MRRIFDGSATPIRRKSAQILGLFWEAKLRAFTIFTQEVD
jgi:hypothetical protein